MLGRVSVKDYQRTLRMQLIQLESQRAQVLEHYEELKRRIGLIDEVLSWDPMIRPVRTRLGGLERLQQKSMNREYWIKGSHANSDSIK